MRKRFCCIISCLLLCGCSLVGTQGESGADHAAPDPADRWGEAISPQEDTSPAQTHPAPDYFVDSRIPRQVRELIAENRKTIFTVFDLADEDRLFDQYLSPELSGEEDRRIAGILADCLLRGEAPAAVTRQEAQADVQFLFDYLKYFYAGYCRFGGDPVFHSIRDDVLSQLSATAEPIGVQYLEELVAQRLLPVVVDGHFALGGTYFGGYHTDHQFSVCEDMTFALEDGVYSTRLDGDTYRLVSVDGAPPHDLFPYLDRDGNPCWALARTGREAQTEQLRLRLEQVDTGQVREETAALSPTDHSYPDEPGGTLYRLDDAGPVPVVVNRRLWGEGDETRQLETMVAEATLLRDAPVVIVDLRGNSGGNSDYASRWLQNFAGMEDYPFMIVVRATRYNRTTLTLMLDAMGLRLGDLESLLPGDEPDLISAMENNPSALRALADLWGLDVRELAELLPADELEVNLPTMPRDPYPNRSLLVVLADQYTGSSGETFVEILCQMENTLYVGTNTAGCCTYVPVSTIYLPSSRLQVNCGYTLSLRPDLSEFEGVGFQPDLWAPPGESLDRVLKFLENCDLIPS